MEATRARERTIEANGAMLCTEARGDPADPAILLIMGIGASMLWWEEPFCRRLAEAGRFVIRYDHRDTGRSSADEPGRPGYSGDDLVADAAGVLDAYGLARAHVVGLSMGGALAQLLALDAPGRVDTLTLITTSAAVPVGRELPPPEARLTRFLATAQVDWADPASIADYVVAYWRALWGPQRTFDERHLRRLAERDVERARDPAAAQNHGLVADEGRARGPLGSIAAPTLVVHGTADPMFPPGHGEALAAAIPGARRLALEGAGHGLDPADWDVVAAAIVQHTARAHR